MCKCCKECCIRCWCECPCFKFEQIIHLDLILICCHALAAFVLFNVYMFIPIVLIRVPRLILRSLDTYCGGRDKL